MLLSACGGGGGSGAPSAPSPPSTPAYSIGGALSGLADGASLVLQNSGGDNTVVSANGTFRFPTSVPNGTAYAVTVLTQPTGQSCAVTSGSGVVSGADVTGIQVSCTTHTYTISGTVSGLNPNARVTLVNNGLNATQVNVNGPFSLAVLVPYGSSYAVTVLIQPPAEICTVTAGTGSPVTSDVSGINITCSAAIESAIHTFDANADGISPHANVIQGSDGNFYGTTYDGGTSSHGTVFKITPAGVETVLHSFTAGATDGSLPTAGLIQGSDGNFYGTTGNGGPTGVGTVFKITSSGVETVIFSFSGADGISPFGALVQGSDGNFYGTTSSGGPNSNGTVFKVTPAGAMTILHPFTGGADGNAPAAALTLGSDGNFYGTTTLGGTHSLGTVFKITPAGVETVLHSFSGGAGDGNYPSAALILGSDGNFYGTTQNGGTGGQGTVFRITSSGVEAVLHSFAGGTTDGSNPYAALTQGTDGNFYGTTGSGGTSGDGTVFKITPAGAETVLHSFAGGTTDGGFPNAGFIQATDGNFYGTNSGGGASNSGNLFKITASGAETVMYSFNSGPEGQNPVGLIQAGDGNFYGTTHFGGKGGNGTVFMIAPGGAESPLYSFAGGAADGMFPSSLVQGADGNFYGTTQQGGAKDAGTVFRITPAGAETVLYSFAGGTDGSQPQAALIQGSDGNFYGTTSSGGASGQGAVFKITAGGVELVLHSFVGGTTDGGSPMAALIQGTDGNFYGTTSSGGTSGQGTVFKITAAGVETVLYAFAGGTADGSSPHAALIEGADGNFYGSTSGGGTSSQGTVFKVGPTGVASVLYSFAGGTADGGGPNAALIQGSDGNFYGTSANGGFDNQGTLFEVTPGGLETVLYYFSGGPDGRNPGGLIQGIDGIFYGTTTNGGSSNLGTVFAF
jgi:uncharacterized repeat protein (TIGR03803 family)